jgi:hypothetical protein
LALPLAETEECAVLYPPKSLTVIAVICGLMLMSTSPAALAQKRSASLGKRVGQQQVTTNRAPTISGTPAASVVVGTAYRFVPSAVDPDGNALVFSITGRPGWAAFDTATGALSGTPGSADVATYTNIVISVSDGRATARLPAFSITVQAYSFGSATLSWIPPTENVDGTALTNLAGYRLYWGRQPKTYTNSIAITNVGITAYVVENLASGTYYFAATAVNANGAESVVSPEVAAVVP